MDAPAHETLAQLAGFENFFTGIVTAKQPDAGVMHCRLDGTTTELEIPLADAEVGAPVRLAIRAGDILLANQEPRGLSARNVLRGHARVHRQRGRDRRGACGRRRLLHRPSHAERGGDASSPSKEPGLADREDALLPPRGAVIRFESIRNGSIWLF